MALLLAVALCSGQEPVQLAPCASIPAVSTETSGGLFSFTPSLPFCTISCPISGAAAWCLSAEPDSFVDTHTESWATGERLGNWSIVAQSAGRFAPKGEKEEEKKKKTKLTN